MPGSKHTLGWSPQSRAERGAASLIVVMLLFFLMALVAAYTSRNLIFEQRTSTNQYRASQAFEAAEAGLNWAVAQLNGGRIDADCEPTTDTTQTTFRARYLENIDVDGNITIRTRTPGPGVEPALMPACVFDPETTTWDCRCPSADDDPLTAATMPAPASPLGKPMFRIRLEAVGNLPTARRDVIRVVSAGCTRVDDSCLGTNPSAPGGDAIAVVSALVTLRSGLSTVPAAAITVREGVTLPASGVSPLFQVVNADPLGSGLTVLAGGTIAGTPGEGYAAVTVPGTPPELSLVGSDSRLGGYRDGARMFGALFGMTPDTHRGQPGAVVLNCSSACNSATVNEALSQNPGKVIWIEGDLQVDGDIGAAPSPGNLAAAELAGRPALLVVTGNAALQSGTVYGAVLSRAPSWALGTGNATVRGALLAEGSLVAAGSQQVLYDAAVLRDLRVRTGSFVRIPGGWKDF